RARVGVPPGAHRGHRPAVRRRPGRPAVGAGGGRARRAPGAPGGGGAGAVPGPLPGRLLPQSARGPAGRLRGRLDRTSGRPAGGCAGMTRDVAELVRLAESAARQAGDLIVAEQAGRPGVAGTKTSPTDVVTEMDQAVENLLRSTL